MCKISLDFLMITVTNEHVEFCIEIDHINKPIHFVWRTLLDVKNYKHDAVQNSEVTSEKWQVAEIQPYGRQNLLKTIGSSSLQKIISTGSTVHFVVFKKFWTSWHVIYILHILVYKPFWCTGCIIVSQGEIKKYFITLFF
jgi:hypothetical protein